MQGGCAVNGRPLGKGEEPRAAAATQPCRPARLRAPAPGRRAVPPPERRRTWCRARAKRNTRSAGLDAGARWRRPGPGKAGYNCEAGGRAGGRAGAPAVGGGAGRAAEGGVAGNGGPGGVLGQGGGLQPGLLRTAAPVLHPGAPRRGCSFLGSRSGLAPEFETLSWIITNSQANTCMQIRDSSRVWEEGLHMRPDHIHGIAHG